MYSRQFGEGWKVCYKDGRESMEMGKKIALDYMEIFDGEYIEKVSGWFFVGKRIYNKGKK